MLLIPQIYLKNGKVAIPEGTTSPIISEDAIKTAGAFKDSGAEAVFCVDLSMTALGASPDLAVVKRIRNEFDLAVYVGGGFKTLQMVDVYMSAGVELVVIGTPAYQQPPFIEDICKRYPGRIAVHIDVKGGHVTIPGYTVVANKTAHDYAERFIKSGVRVIFYSDVGAGGVMGPQHFDELLNFCKTTAARIVCTSEVSNVSEIGKIAGLGAPRLDGLVLAKSIYEGRVDLRAATTMVGDLAIASGDEPTMTEL